MRAEELVQKLNKLSYEYYTLDNPTVSDAEYDALYDELVKIEKETGVVLPDSPTRRVGGEILSGFSSYKHRARLFSLDKCKEKGELVRFLDKADSPEYTVEYKYDGLTINLTYEDGVFTRATTRGDGETGEDVTAQILTVKSVPLSIKAKGILEIQGEAIMRLSTLKKYNETAVEPLKNARNAVAGAVRNLNPAETAKRAPEVVCYNVGYSSLVHFESQSEMYEFLKENGFKTGYYFKVVNSADEVVTCLDEIENNRENLDFLIDGAVIKVNSTALQDRLGNTEKFPRWAMAFKFKAEEMTTRVTGVKWQVSRTGKLNPLALLEPVDIGGVRVQKATLNNYSEILRKDIKINSRVFVRRSNDVIPEILGVAEHTPESVDIEKPTKCPVCGAPVRYDDVFIYCTNDKTCVSRTVSMLEHFSSKDCMDIEGLSEKTLEALYNDLGIRWAYELYSLSMEDLLKLDGFKEKKAQNLLDSLEKSKNTELWRFIHALAIPGIGKKASKQLSDAFGDIDSIIGAKREDLVALDDFGEITADNVVNYFSDETNLNIVKNLLDQGIVFATLEEKTGAFSGLVVVLTGSLEKFKRSYAQSLIEERGGAVADSVSKRVNLVVAGESAGSKLEKAKKLGIKIIDEEEFASML